MMCSFAESLNDDVLMTVLLTVFMCHQFSISVHVQKLKTADE
jgi:hypothetical protein